MFSKNEESFKHVTVFTEGGLIHIFSFKTYKLQLARDAKTEKLVFINYNYVLIVTSDLAIEFIFNYFSSVENMGGI